MKKLDKKILEFISDLKKTLDVQSEPEGLGLAANQVAVDSRIFLVKTKDKKTKVFINPEITFFSEEKVIMTEGCLSVKDLYSEIERPQKITIKYQTIENIRVNPLEISENPKGKLANNLSFYIEEEFTDLTARVIQHEMDHLNGIVFIDRALKQKAKIYRLEKNGDKKEYVEIKI